MVTRGFAAFLLAALVLAPVVSVPTARGQATVEQLRQEAQLVGQLPAAGQPAATVDGQPIDVGEVTRVLKSTLRNRPVTLDALPKLEAEALDQLISRRLLTRFLDQAKIAVSDAEIDRALEERQKTYGQRLVEALAQSGLTVDQYREDLAWELRWSKFLSRYLTDAHFERFFEGRRKEFDGTEVRVSHILLRPTGAANVAEIRAIAARAVRLLEEILTSKTTFEEAAEKYSDAPSRRQGGDIGFIPRRGLMDEAFSAAAFKLAKDEISEPVITPFGIHLIKCTDIRPGTKTWRDVRAQLEPLVYQEALAAVAKKMRETTPVQYTGAISYTDPATDKLIVAERLRASGVGEDLTDAGTTGSQ